MYAECPVTWASKMQTEVALMSEGLQMAIPFMSLIEEMVEQGIVIFLCQSAL